MTDPMGIWEQGRMRQERLLREAEIDRLLSEAGVAQASLRARVLQQLGALLTYCGERLGAPRAEVPPAASVPAGQPTEWRILADGTLVARAPGESVAPEAGAPVSVVVRLEPAPAGRVSVLCWNAERGGEPREASEGHIALFYLSQELAPVQ